MIYSPQDPQALGEHYLRHVDAMTSEGLHAKSDIAAQLAWRDQKIDSLQARIDMLMFEYCPDEMTPEQVTEWFSHQRNAMADAATLNKLLGPNVPVEAGPTVLRWTSPRTGG